MLQMNLFPKGPIIISVIELFETLLLSLYAGCNLFFLTEMFNSTLIRSFFQFISIKLYFDMIFYKSSNLLNLITKYGLHIFYGAAPTEVKWPLMMMEIH